MINSKLNVNKSKIALLCSAAFSFSSLSAVAQETQADSQVDNDVEVVSIVGHKLVELNQESDGGALGNRSLLETPFSVDLITLEDMEIRQVNTLNSLFSREASVSVDGSAYSSFGDTIRVRGLSLDYTQSFKVNGLSINSFSGELPYEAFEQVTLMKGATGFMYGMAAPGGVVNYVTKKANMDAVSANVGIRSDSVLSAHVDASKRFGNASDYGVRVNVVKEEGDTYLNGGGIDRQTLAVAFDAQLTDSLLWTVDLIASDRKVEESWNKFTVSMDSTEALPDTVSGTRNLGIDGTHDTYENLIVLSTLDWQINDNWSAKVAYDYSENETSWIKVLAYLQNTAGDLELATYEQFFDVDYDQVQGIINGEVSTGSIQHSLVFGATYQEATTYRNDGGQYGRIVTWGYATDNLFEPADVPTYTPTLKKDLQMAWIDTQRSFFASDFITFNENWEALVGIRVNGIEHTPSEYFSSHDNYDDTAVSPTVALMYKPSDTTTLYASYVESFEGQTSTVAEGYANEDELLPPLESSQYEIGIKTVGDGWSVTSALFRIEQGAEIVTDDNYLIQDGVTLYQGIEFSGAIEVNENLSLYGDIMLLDAEYDKTSSGIEGNDVGGAPTKQFSLQTNYNVAAIPGLTLNLGGKYHGKTTLDSTNYWEVDAYTVFYGGASYSTEVAGKNITFIGTVDNLFDKEYYAVADSYNGLRIGEPRTFAAKVKVDF